MYQDVNPQALRDSCDDLRKAITEVRRIAETVVEVALENFNRT